MFCLWLVALGVVSLPLARSLPRLSCAWPLLGVLLGGAGPLPSRAVGGCCRLRWFGLGCGSSVLSFRVLCLLLFAVWGGFFRGWGGFFRGWAVSGALGFFVSLFRGRLFLFGSCPVRLGCGRGACVRVVSRFRLVRAGRVACPRLPWAFPLGSRRGCVSPVRLLAVWPPWVLLVGGLVGRFRLRGFAGCVGRLRWRAGSGRSAFAFFLVFFNICRVGLWHPLCAGAFFAALDGGKLMAKVEKILL